MAEPQTIRAGTTTTWSRELASYSVETTSGMVYTLSSSAGNITITATGSGTTWTVNEAPATTANYTADRYVWKLVATVGANQYLVDEGNIEVIAATAANNDLLNVRDRIDAVETELAARVSGKPHEYSISTEGTSRSLKRMDDDGLRAELTRLRRRLHVLEQEDRRKRGQGTQNVLKVQFTNPR